MGLGWVVLMGWSYWLRWADGLELLVGRAGEWGVGSGWAKLCRAVRGGRVGVMGWAALRCAVLGGL